MLNPPSLVRFLPFTCTSAMVWLSSLSFMSKRRRAFMGSVCGLQPTYVTFSELSGFFSCSEKLPLMSVTADDTMRPPLSCSTTVAPMHSPSVVVTFPVIITPCACAAKAVTASNMIVNIFFFILLFWY